MTTNSFLSRFSPLGGGASTLLPLHTTSSHKARNSDEYDLSDLSPRPDDALLSPDSVRDFAYPSDTSPHRRGSQQKGKSRAKQVGYDEPPFPPPSVLDRRYRHRGERLDASQQMAATGPALWRPPSSHDDEEEYGHVARQRSPHVSFVDSVFLRNPRPSSSSRAHIDIDTTLRTLQRREIQLQNEIQKILDAQNAALEREQTGNASQTSSDQGTGTGSSTPRQTSRDSRSPMASSRLQSRQDSSAGGTGDRGYVVPVRQPASKPLSLRQARARLARSITLLTELKADEDAYLTSALAERKVALTKLTRLGSQQQSIKADLAAIEDNPDDPHVAELAEMEDEHKRTVREIEVAEEKLRGLKRAKVVLERKMEEARSRRESALSGYRGALKECDLKIGEVMHRPGIKVVQVDEPQDHAAEEEEHYGDNQEQDGSGAGSSKGDSQHLTGIQFLSLRPERRTLEMAQEWWEGEISLLSQRQLGVSRERTALLDGAQAWEAAVQIITDYETSLKRALSQSMIMASDGEDFENAALRDNYENLGKTIKNLEDIMQYVDEQGYNLLICAIGAELDAFAQGREILREVLRSRGVQVKEDPPLLSKAQRENSLVDLQEHEDIAKQAQQADELSNSVVRRWDGTEADASQGTQNTGLQRQFSRDESDNEVPAGLLNESRIEESEDEHLNPVPAEFLSAHQENAEDGPSLARIDSASSANEVPADLLSESQQHLDALD